MRLGILSFLLLSLLAISVAPMVDAQYAQAPVISKPIILDKRVLDPKSAQFVDNLVGEQYRFLPGQEVKFRIEVKNTGSGDLTNIILKDILPAGMSLGSGEGVYNASGNVLTVTVDRLRPGESKFWFITATMRGDKGGVVANLTCFNNKVEAWIGGEMVSDTASACVQSQVLGEVSELPVTGVASTLVIIGSVSLAGLGLLVVGSKLSRKIFSRAES